MLPDLSDFRLDHLLTIYWHTAAISENEDYLVNLQTASTATVLCDIRPH